MVTTFYPPYSFGGDATYVRGLARGLVARGHDVTVVACRDAYNLLREREHTHRPTETETDDDGVNVHWLHSWAGPMSPLLTQQTGRPLLKRRALARLMATPFDVINFHNISLVGGPAVLGCGEAAARLYTLHEHWLVCPTHIFWKNRSHACDSRTCIRCCLRSGIPPQLWRYTGLRDRGLAPVDLLLAPSAFTAEIHRRDGVTRPIAVLPLFSAIEPPFAASPRSIAKPTFLFVGRVTAPKGIELLTRVVAGLPDIVLDIVGEGDLLEQLRARHAGHRNIHFRGRLPQAALLDHYRAATAVILPSLAPETFGLAIVEAAALGTPAIVAKGSGGAEELAAQTGGIVYNDESSLAASLRILAADRALAARLGDTAREAYRRLYTRKAHLDSYLAHVDRIIGKRSHITGQGFCARS